MYLLRAYQIVHKADIICLSETYLDFNFSENDENLIIQGYNLVRCDHLFNIKRDRVCICYKNSALLQIFNIYFLQERLTFTFLLVTRYVIPLLFIDLLINPAMNLTHLEKWLNLI